MTVCLTKTAPSRLAVEIRRIVPGAHIVRTTPVLSTRSGEDAELRPKVFVLDVRREELPVPLGAGARLGALLAAACPGVSPWQSLTWHADTGAVTPLRPRRSIHPYGLGGTS